MPVLGGRGLANDWHLVHLGSRAVGGAALVMVEATAVTPDGRISPGDMGIWSDRHVEPLARIARFVQSQGAVPGIQLAHAGRKASCDLPWSGGRSLEDRRRRRLAGGGAEPDSVLTTATRCRIALDDAGIDGIVAAFEAAARRALAPASSSSRSTPPTAICCMSSSRRSAISGSDDYGGSLENRMRLLLRVAERLRAIVPDELPLFVRISATDWVDGGWDVEQSVGARQAPEGAWGRPDRRVVRRHGADGAHPGRQGLPGAVRRRAFATRRGIRTGAVGMITEIAAGRRIITGGDADLVFLGRELLREPYWALKAEAALGAEPCWPIQYGYAVKRRAK